MLPARAGSEQVDLPVRADAAEESDLVGIAVLPAEAVPCSIEIEHGEVREERVSRNGVPRALEAKEHRFAGRHRLEWFGRFRRPEVHLVDNTGLRASREKVEPGPVGQGNVGVQGHTWMVRRVLSRRGRGWQVNGGEAGGRGTCWPRCGPGRALIKLVDVGKDAR